MNINEYLEFTRTTAIYPKEVAVDYLIHGLTSEAGEVAGKFKKKLRDGEKDTFKTDMLSELSDVQWYICRLVDELGFTMDDLIEHNVQKLSSRKERNVLSGSGDNR
jgi:NTP pyrophosphatase (non-canonical NTP hydrolase)